MSYEKKLTDIKFARPVVAVLGGAPTGDKIDLIDGLLDRTDTLVLGGGLANNFLKARGGRIGRSLWDEKAVAQAQRLLEKAQERDVKVLLPMDTLAANEMRPGIKPSLEGSMALFDDKIGMDIGPRTVERFCSVILSAGTVIWSGAMGVTELPAFRTGTEEIIRAVCETRAEAIVFGTDSLKAVENAKKKLCRLENREAVLDCMAQRF